MITPALFRFLAELAKHNDRIWFQTNKERYHALVRDPLLEFISDFAPKLDGVSRYMFADPSPVGGSLFRIYRDTRFATDKTPYKTHAGLTFRHVDGREVHGPIFYLHLAPGEVFAAAGMWNPEADNLKRVRDAIVAKPAAWKKVANACTLDDSESLARAPRGYDPEHPLLDALKRKSFTSSTDFTERDACAPKFAELLARTYADSAPLMRFLTAAVGLRY